MTSKQIPGSVYAPDGSLYITLTDGSGNLTTTSGLPASLLWGVYNATPNSPGTGYVPGDAVTLTGGTGNTIGGWTSNVANIIVIETQVVSATVAQAGTYTGTTGPLTVTGTSGTGTKFQASVTATNGSGITAVNSITVAGDYQANPTSISAEPVTGSNLSNAQLNVVMGASGLYTQNPGFYSILPTLTANPQNSTTGSGTGLTINVSVLPISSWVAPISYDPSFPGTLGENFVIGLRLPPSFTTGVENTIVGTTAPNGITTGSFNCILNAGILLAGASSSNTLAGNDCVRNATAASNITAMGAACLKAHNGSQIASSLTAFGTGAMLNWNNTANTNPAIVVMGDHAAQGAASSTFVHVTGIGDACLSALTSSNGGIVAVGRSAANKLTTGSGTFIGDNVAITTAQTGTGNIIIGVSSAADTPANSTSNYFGLFGANATPVLAATSINTTTPTWTMQGTLNLATGPVLVATPLGLGYATGAGGTVTQITSKSTAVALNKPCGQITMSNASLGGQSEVSFTLTNSTIAATDVVIVSIASGATANSYVVGVAATAAGSCVIQLGNVTLATALTDAVVLNFAVIKAVTA